MGEVTRVNVATMRFTPSTICKQKKDSKKMHFRIDILSYSR